MPLNLESPQPHPAKSGRRGSKKTRTGCVTCKIRRVKCDEGRPSCTRCVSTGRRCDGYLDAAVCRAVVPNPAAASENRFCELDAVGPNHAFKLWPSSTPQERRAFDYFVKCAGPSISGIADGDFWCHVVPQLGCSEHVHWDAIIAIASMYEASRSDNLQSSERNSYSLSDKNYRDAVTWYNRAIVQSRKSVSENRTDAVVAALLSSIFFTCIEILQDNLAQALALIRNAVKILANAHQTGTPRSSEAAFASIIPILKWLSRACGSFGDNESAILLSDYYKHTDRRPANLVLNSLSEAQWSLEALVPDVFDLHKDASIYKIQRSMDVSLYASIIARQYSLRNRLDTWRNLFQQLGSMDASEHKLVVASTLNKHAVLFIHSQTSLLVQQTEYDQFFPEFDSIVSNVETILKSRVDETTCGDDSQTSRIHFRFDSQIIPVLCFVIGKCREPHIRRRALSLLDEAPNREGMWKVGTALRLTPRIIAYEEGGLDLANKPLRSANAAPIPDENSRIQDFKVLKDGWEIDGSFARKLEPEPVLMRVTKRVTQPDGTRTTVQESIPV